MEGKNSEPYWALIARKGVPKKIINDMRLAVFDDAIAEAKMLMNERWYSIFAYALVQKHPEWSNEEMLDIIRMINDVMNSIADGYTNWTKIEEYLKEERGFMVRDTVSDDGKVIKRHFVDTYEEYEKEDGTVAKGVMKR